MSRLFVICAGWAALFAVACGLGVTGERPAAPDAGVEGRPPGTPDPGPPLGGTSSGSPPTGDASPVRSTCDRVLMFDGQDDFVSVADDSVLDLLDAFTVEAWIKPTNTVEVSGSELTIVSHHDEAKNAGWDLIVKNQKIELRIYGKDSTSPRVAGSGGTGAPYVLAERWAHVAATFDGKYLRVYHDGTFRDFEELASLTRVAYRGPLVIGRAAYSAKSFFNGLIDDVRISDVARYVGDFAPKPIAPLPKDIPTVALWRFDEASGDDVVNDRGPLFTGKLADAGAAPLRTTAECVPFR